MGECKSKQEKIEDFVNREGRKAVKILSNLGKKEPFVSALGTDVGQELLKDILEIAEGKLDKIIDGTANEMDLAGFRICKFLATKWATRVNSYNEGLSKIFN